VQLPGKAYPQQSDYPLAREGIVTPGYFETFQTKISSGREFTGSDTATGQPVAIVNESFARIQFPGVDPLGGQFKRIRPGNKESWMTVVGLVRIC
jgi:putative ABC transport system permease protein